MWNYILLTATAVNKDLFQYSEGDLYSVQPLVNILGGFAIKVISIVGFGIVIFSILKNALSGLYVINPAFWDRVDDIKNQAIGGVSNTVNELVGRTNGNYAAQKVGGIITFLLSLVPNVKALTDFDDGVEVDKKQYFTKSLLLLFVQVFIGMMIFFGYPSKIANWIGSGGTYMLDAMMNNIDPVQVVQGLSDSITVYNLSTAGSPDPFDKTVNKGASEMIKVVQTKYSDMKKEPTQKTAYALENHLMTALSTDNVRAILGATEGYDITVSAMQVSSVPTYSSAFQWIPGRTDAVIATSTNGIVQIKTWVAGSSLPTGSTKVGGNDYFVWTITATPVSISKTSTANLILFGGFDSGSLTADGNNSVNLKLNGIKIGSGSNLLRGTPGGSMQVDAIDANGDVKHTYTVKLMTATLEQSVGGSDAILSFAGTDRDSLREDMNSGCYFKINLTGSWKFDVVTQSGAAQNTVTLTVQEIRVAAGVNNTAYGLSIWDDITNKVSTSTVKSAAEAIKKSSMTGASSEGTAGK